MRVVWFELDNPEQELSFERYRKLLRTLRREGHAAVYDLVSRPGAHYVAWETPPPAARPLGREVNHEDAAAVRALLESHGHTLEEAELYAVEGTPKVYGLVGGAPGASRPAPTAPPPPRRRLHIPRWRSLQPPPWLLPWLPGLVFAFLGLALLASSLGLRANRRVVVMPDVLGADANAASALLHRRGLAVRSEPVGSNVGLGATGASGGDPGTVNGAANAPAGTVVDTEPPPGTRLRKGRTALLLYALPPGQRPQVEVPDLRGQPFEGALRSTLEAAGLNLGRVAHVPAAEARGLVIAQSPPPGNAPAESTLSLLVSEGPQGETTFVPDLLGSALIEALERARAAGFGEDRVETTWVESADAPAGTVLGQNLTPYLETPLETATLRLLVAGAPDAGSAPRAPDLIGMARPDAERVGGTDAALRFALIDEPNLPAGVVSQTPAPGAPLEGDTLEVTLNLPGLFRPNVQVVRRTLELRRANYRFPVEANVPASNARVEAHYLSGEREVIAGARVSGGEMLDGTWLTTEYGPITFVLYLNNIEYARAQTNP